MYPQRTPPESGMEKSGRRNLISSQCLACYVNLPTSPRLSCTRLLSFFKSYQIGKKNRPSITLSKCYILSRISSSWKFESPPPLHDRPGRFGQKNTSSSPHHHQPPPSVQPRNIGQNVNWDTLFSAVLFFLHEKCKSDLNNMPLVKTMRFVS